MAMCVCAGVYPFSDCTKDNPDVHTVLEHGYGRQELTAAVAAEGLRPTLPHSAPAGLQQLLQAAWSLDPHHRPSAQEMRDRLAALLQQHQAEVGMRRKQQRFSDDSTGSFAEAESTVVSPTAMDVDQQQVYFNSSVLQQQQQQEQRSAADGSVLSSCDSELDLQQLDSNTVVSETAGDGSAVGASFAGSSSNLNRHAGPVRRPPCKSCSSLSTISAEPTAATFSSSKAPLSTEAANAAAAAAAAAAVPAGDSLRGVLSMAAAASNSVAQQQQKVETGAFSALGPRETNEDRQVVVQGLGGDANVTLAAVFDGHRGCEVAAYAAAQMPRHLLVASVQLSSVSNSSSRSSALPAADSSSGPAQALQQAFLATDAGFWQTWQAEMHANAAVGQYAERYPGCTALAAVIAGQQLFVANAGDGRAVMSRDGTAVPLSRQHTADLEDERARVVASGGTVQYRGGSWRVGPAALQVTRALGDFDLKRSSQQQQQHPYQQQPYSTKACSSCSSSPTVVPAAAMPVTAEPEVVALQLNSGDQFLILGTDGLWDVVTDQEAVGLVQDTVKDPALCAKRLVTEALARGSKDNVTAVVVFLQPKHTLERVWLGSSGASVPAATPTFFGSRRATTAALQQQSDAEAGVVGAAGPSGVADELMDTY
jgi:serine/threonine protein phosphatase PrpC